MGKCLVDGPIADATSRLHFPNRAIPEVRLGRARSHRPSEKKVRVLPSSTNATRINGTFSSEVSFEAFPIDVSRVHHVSAGLVRRMLYAHDDAILCEPTQEATRRNFRPLSAL